MHGERPEPYLDQPLPSSDEAERAILGAVLIDNDLMSGAAETLSPDDFYSPKHRKVFAAMLELYSRSEKIDPILIGDELKKDGPIDPFGGIAGITVLSHGIPHFTNIDGYIEIVRDKSNLRQLIRACNKITTEALSEAESDKVFAHAQESINNLCLQAESGDTEEHFAPLSKVIDTDVIKALDNLRHGTSTKIKTGFEAIDLATGGGLALSDVLLLAADTGAGKSALALQMAYQITQAGVPTAFLAGEMTNCENALRLLSQLSGITNLNWLSHISDTEYQILTQWAIKIRDSAIHFEHRISDMHTLRTHLQALVRRKKVKVLVIDYIQLFKMEKLDKRKRNERIAEASQEVKRLANELGIAIIEVAQFNREGAKSVQAGIHDLEGSGQLEKDASLIFILEIGEAEFSDYSGRKYVEATIRIKKGRNVGKGTVEGRFYGRSVQFEF